MTEEATQESTQQPSTSGHLPDVENLADSEDPELIEARAKLLEAQAKLTKASTPLFDKIVIRGVLPIALALVGPWAAQTYEKSQIEQAKQGETFTALEKLLEEQRESAKGRRARFQQIEEAKAVELAAMAAMVTRLDETLKYSLIQMAVAQALAKVEPVGETPSMEPDLMPGAKPVPSREGVTRGVAEQIRLPGVTDVEIRRIASESYDKVLRTKGR